MKIGLGILGGVILIADGATYRLGTSAEKHSGARSGETQAACLTIQEADQVWVPGGTFQFGTDHAYPEEAPAREVTVEGFWMDRHEVTNARFARFVAKTGYVTLAERSPDPEAYPDIPPEKLVPGSAVFSQPSAVPGGMMPT